MREQGGKETTRRGREGTRGRGGIWEQGRVTVKVKMRTWNEYLTKFR